MKKNTFLGIFVDFSENWHFLESIKIANFQKKSGKIPKNELFFIFLFYNQHSHANFKYDISLHEYLQKASTMCVQI